jgi:hypothetical protein
MKPRRPSAAKSRVAKVRTGNSMALSVARTLLAHCQSKYWM